MERPPCSLWWCSSLKRCCTAVFLSSLPLPRSPPSGWDSLSVKHCANVQKSFPAPRCFQLEQEPCSVPSTFHTGCWLWGPDWPSVLVFSSLLRLMRAPCALPGCSCFCRSQARACREGAWRWNWLLAPHESPCQVNVALSLGVSDVACDPALVMLAGSREGKRQGEIWPLWSVLRWFLSLSSRFYVSEINVMFGNELFFWILEVLGDNTRLPAATSNRDQSTLLTSAWCLLLGNLIQAVWPSALESRLAGQVCIAVGGGRAVEGDTESPMEPSFWSPFSSGKFLRARDSLWNGAGCGLLYCFLCWCFCFLGWYFESGESAQQSIPCKSYCLLQRHFPGPRNRLVVGFGTELNRIPRNSANSSPVKGLAASSIQTLLSTCVGNCLL